MEPVVPSWVSNLETQPLLQPPITLPKLMWQVLSSRGFQTAKSIEDIYSSSLQNMSDPFLLDGMEEAVTRLLQALETSEKVCIYADFDLDGTPGLALLKNGLELLGFKDLSYYQPRRLTEGYGFHEHLLSDFKTQGVSLIVTVDVGITAVQTVEAAKLIGIDVIITDHHLPAERLPDAVAVVNPNKGTCSSELGHLCGTGVAFYLILALRKRLREQGALKKDFNPKELLDFFAIATITDMVPLVKENRVLVKHGLAQLENTKRPGLRALLEAVDMVGRKLNSQDVGFRFAPKLNALSRMEKGLLPIDVMLSESRTKANGLIAEVLANNEERVSLQKMAEKKAQEMVGETAVDGFIWVYSTEFHKGIVGLVATKMAQIYGVPAFVGAENEAGEITGSARLPSELGSVLKVLNFCETHLEGHGGHAAAAGFHLKSQNAQELYAQMKTYFQTQVDRNRVEFTINYDGQGLIGDLQGSFMTWYEGFGPYGVSFEVPVFKLTEAQVKSVRELKGGHFKFNLECKKTKARVDAIWFSPSQHHPVVSQLLEPEESVELIGEPQWNYFAGKKTLQVLVKDMKRV